MKDRKQYMAIVQENTELLLQLISDILDLSKMESGALNLSRVIRMSICFAVRLSVLYA